MSSITATKYITNYLLPVYRFHCEVPKIRDHSPWECFQKARNYEISLNPNIEGYDSSFIRSDIIIEYPEYGYDGQLHIQVDECTESYIFSFIKPVEDKDETAKHVFHRTLTEGVVYD
jgi:hypothetical protein